MEKSLSTNKIIFFILFICGALITSLFLFHLRHKSTSTTLAEDAGTVFSIPREIKSFELITADNKAFTEKDFRNHWTLLFFGFTHCSSVCPTTLDLMNRVYSKLHASYPNLQVVLISLDPDRDTPQKLAQYTQSFNPEFIGVSGKIQEVRKLQSQLGVYSGRDPSSSDSNYQLQHTSSIMLVNPKGEWSGLFKFGMNPEQFAKAFEQSMKITSHA